MSSCVLSAACHSRCFGRALTISNLPLTADMRAWIVARSLNIRRMSAFVQMLWGVRRLWHHRALFKGYRWSSPMMQHSRFDPRFRTRRPSRTKRAVARLPACISEAAHLFRRNSTGYESYGEATCPTSSAMARQCADSNSFLLNSPEETSGGALRFNRTCVRHAVRLNYQGSWNGLISARNDQASRGCWTRWNTSSAIDAGWQKKSSGAFGRRCRCQGTSIAASITR